MRKSVAFAAFVLMTSFASPSVQANPLCSNLFESETVAAKRAQSALPNRLTPTTAEAIQNILRYEQTVGGQILERQFVIDPFLISLIAKEHMLLVGPPGNAKTTLSKLLMENVVDAETGAPSFYSMQMNKEITLSDTHGGLNFKSLSEGVVERNYHEGLLGAKLGFIDEAFDVRPGAFRNILDILAERAHSQGTSHHKGKTEVIVAASNRSLAEVYEDFNNSEQPRAMIDRFAYVFYVPKEMASIKSDRQIFSGTRASSNPVHKLTFQDLDVVRSYVPKVEIPDHIASLASLIHYRLTPEFEAQEVKAMAEYREKVQAGEHVLPPFRAAKYMSPRTLGKAGGILKSIVVLDFVRRNGKRSLIATVDDLQKLRAFYQMNGPSTAELNAQIGRALKEYEKDQIKSVQIERRIVDSQFDSVLADYKTAYDKREIPDFSKVAKNYQRLSVDEKRQFTDLVKDTYLQLRQRQIESDQNGSKNDASFDAIVDGAIIQSIRETVQKIWGQRVDQVLSGWETQKPTRRRGRIKVSLEESADVITALQGLSRESVDKSSPTPLPENLRAIKMDHRTAYGLARDLRGFWWRSSTMFGPNDNVFAQNSTGEIHIQSRNQLAPHGTNVNFIVSSIGFKQGLVVAATYSADFREYVVSTWNFGAPGGGEFASNPLNFSGKKFVALRRGEDESAFVFSTDAIFQINGKFSVSDPNKFATSLTLPNFVTTDRILIADALPSTREFNQTLVTLEDGQNRNLRLRFYEALPLGGLSRRNEVRLTEDQSQQIRSALVTNDAQTQSQLTMLTETMGLITFNNLKMAKFKIGASGVLETLEFMSEIGLMAIDQGRSTVAYVTSNAIELYRAEDFSDLIFLPTNSDKPRLPVLGRLNFNTSDIKKIEFVKDGQGLMVVTENQVHVIDLKYEVER